MKWVYLSPHLDDAVLSAGGWIYEKIRAGDMVEIWTLISGTPPDTELSPFAQVIHFQWGIASAADVVRARRAEDLSALRVLGAQARHFDFLDCIYRRGHDGEWLYSSVFVAPHNEDTQLVSQMAEMLATHLTPDDQLICQLGIGGHVDHILVRCAAEQLGRAVLYAADIPYLFKAPEELAPQVTNLKAHILSLSPAAITAWQNAIAKYESQINSLFDHETDMREKIAHYAKEGACLWSVT